MKTKHMNKQFLCVFNFLATDQILRNSGHIS